MTENVPLHSLHEQVIRTYDVGVRFLDVDRKERRRSEKETNAIIKELQQEAFSRITPVAVEKTLQMVRADKRIKGLFGVPKITKETGDRDNLSQISYIQLLGRAESTIELEQKAQKFIIFLQEHPVEASSWLVFGRQSYLEHLMAKYYKIQFRYARNVVQAFRRRLDTYLPAHYQLDQILPVLSQRDIQQAFNDHVAFIQNQFNNLSTLTTRQEQYQKKLLLLEPYTHKLSQFIIDYLQTTWYQPSNPTTRPRTFWRCIRLLSAELQKFIYKELQIKNFRTTKSYQSVLRSIMSSALDKYLQSTVQLLLTTNTICPEHMVTPPYETIRKNNIFYHKVPLQLVTGAKYVIQRDGNKQLLTQEALEQGYIPILVKPNKRKIGWNKAHSCIIMIHTKLQEFIKRGAMISSLILYAGTAPSYKIRCQVVMMGEYGMFISTKKIITMIRTLQEQLPDQQPVPILGLDVNRISNYMVAFSEKTPIPASMVVMTERYFQLGLILSELSKKVTEANELRQVQPTLANQVKYNKLQTERNLVHTRRMNLRAELHREGSRFTSAMLVFTNSQYLACEQLTVSTDGTKNNLAKAVTSMPDDLELYIRAVTVVQAITKNSKQLITVDPYKTSQSSHIGCIGNPAGKLKRVKGQYDIITCSVCHKSVNSHTNAALHLVQRCRDYIQQQISTSVSSTLSSFSASSYSSSTVI